MKMMYCIECGEVVLIDDAIVEGHTVLDGVSMSWNGEYFPEQDVYFCTGPFEDVEPVEDPDWDLNLEEPNGDELFVMNMAAERLLLDLEGE